MGQVFSILKSFVLISIGLLSGWYLCEKQHRNKVTFEGIGKKLDSAISDIDRELRGRTAQSDFQDSVVGAISFIARPFEALFGEVQSWFGTGNMPTGHFAR
jgi:hypothetical protein